MSRSAFMKGIPAFMGMLVLILDSRCALESCQDAVLLCIRTVIPSLFPFIFFSGLVCQNLWGNSGKILRGIGWIMNVPPGAQSLLIPGFLGGYPVGAQSVADAFYAHKLDRQNAQKLLSFCSNAGPAFLFGMVGQMFPEKAMVWYLWLIQILSAAMTGSMYAFSPVSGDFSQVKNFSVSDSLNHCIKVMGLICGWILLYRIGIGYLDRWFLWMVPETLRVIIWGFLELTNGCCALAQICSVPVRFVACSAMLSFGGMCVMMQTMSVTRGLSITAYLRGKLLQTLLSSILAVCTVLGYGLEVFVLSFLFLLLPKMYKKRGSILQVSGV